MGENTLGRLPEQQVGSSRQTAGRHTIPFGRKSDRNGISSLFAGNSPLPQETRRGPVNSQIQSVTIEAFVGTSDSDINTQDGLTGNGDDLIPGTFSNQHILYDNTGEHSYPQVSVGNSNGAINTQGHSTGNRDVHAQGTFSNQHILYYNTGEHSHPQVSVGNSNGAINTQGNSTGNRDVHEQGISSNQLILYNDTAEQFTQQKTVTWRPADIQISTSDSSDTVRNYKDIRTPSDASDNSYESGSSHTRTHINVTENRHGNPNKAYEKMNKFSEIRECVSNVTADVQRRRENPRIKPTVSCPGGAVREVNFPGKHKFRSDPTHDQLHLPHDSTTTAQLEDVVYHIRRNENVLHPTEIASIIRDCNSIDFVPYIIELALIQPHEQLTQFCLVKARDILQTYKYLSIDQMHELLNSWSKCNLGKRYLCCSPETWLIFLKVTYTVVIKLLHTLGSLHEPYDDVFDIVGKYRFVRNESDRFAKRDTMFSRDIAFYADFICGTLDTMDIIVMAIRPLLFQINVHFGGRNKFNYAGFYDTFVKLDIHSQVVLIRSMLFELPDNQEMQNLVQQCASVYRVKRTKSVKKVWNRKSEQCIRNKDLHLFLNNTETLIEVARMQEIDIGEILPTIVNMKVLNQQDASTKTLFLRMITPLMFYSGRPVYTYFQELVSKMWSDSGMWLPMTICQIVKDRLIPFLGTINDERHLDVRQSVFYLSGTFEQKNNFDKPTRIQCKVFVNPTADVHRGQRFILESNKDERDILENISSESGSLFVSLVKESTFDTVPTILVTVIEDEFKPLSTFLRQHLETDDTSNIPLDRRLSIIAVVISILEFCHARGILLGSFAARNFVCHETKDIIKMADMASAVRADREEDILTYTGHKSDPLQLLSAAPETVLKSQRSSYSEVFVLGHLMNEILAHGIQSHEEWYNSIDAMTLLAQIYKYKWIPERRPGVPIAIFKVILECIVWEPEKRIKLARLKQNVTLYSKNLSKASVENKGTFEIQGIAYLCNIAKQEPTFHNEISYPPPELLDMNSIEPLEDEDSSLCRDFAKEYHDTILLARKKALTAVQIEEVKPSDSPKQQPSNSNKFLEPLLWQRLENRKDQMQRNNLLELKHENLVRIINFKKAKPTNRWQIEYIMEGSGAYQVLIDYYFGHYGHRSSRINHYLQIARGINYLHSKDIVHGSLQAQYCYIFPASNTVKIGRVSRMTQLSKGHHDSDMMDVMAFPFDAMPIDIKRYIPDEVLSFHSDIAMFGYAILQLENAAFCSGDEIYPFHSFDLKTVKQFQKCGLKPYLSERRPSDKVGKALDELIYECIQSPAHERPDSSILVKKITNIERPRLPAVPPEHETNDNMNVYLQGNPDGYQNANYDGH